MATKEEDRLEELAKGLGNIVAPSSAEDTKSMLKAIQNAALIRAGIGIMGQRKMGESGFDVASRVLGDVAKSSADQLKSYATTASLTQKKSDKALTDFGKAQNIYNKTFFQPDAQTGALTQLRQEFMELEIKPPTQEWFKNNLLNEKFLLGNTGQGENYIEFHLKQAEKARKRGEKPPEYEETFGTYNIIMNLER